MLLNTLTSNALDVLQENDNIILFHLSKHINGVLCFMDVDRDCLIKYLRRCYEEAFNGSVSTTEILRYFLCNLKILTCA